MKSPAPFLIAVILTALLIPSCNQEKESVPADSFIGEWYTVKGDFETYSFLKDSNNYIFVATQNLRPVAFGTWKIFKDEFIVATDDGTASSYRFTLKDDTLILNDGEQIYTRTEPLEIRFPEVKVLKSITESLINLKFSAPHQADLNWAAFVDKKGEKQNPSIIGYSISAKTTVSSGSLNDIYNSIVDSGFEPDPELMVENRKEFRDDNQVVIVRTNRPGGETSDSLNIQITSGYILK